MSVLSILKELKEIESTNGKIKFLKENVGNEELKLTFKMAYDKSILYGMSSIPLQDVEVPVSSLNDVLNWILENIVTKKFTGNVARDELIKQMKHLNHDDQIVVQMILGRDLDCGVNATNANKVWKGLIEEQPQMLCVPCNDKNLSRIVYPAYAQLKADGSRAFVNVEYLENEGGYNITITSRNGNLYHGLDHIIKEVDQYLTMAEIESNFTLDGEIIAICLNDGVAERQRGNGIVNKSIRGTITEEEALQLHFIVWDYIDDKAIETPYKVRKNKLIDFVDSLHVLSSNIGVGIPSHFRLVEERVVNSLDEARDYYRELVQRGEEGIILKNIDSHWKNGRSNDQVKFKEELTAELRIVSATEHSKDKGLLGSLYLKSDCGNVEVNVGSGFTNTRRYRDKKTKEWVDIPLHERGELDRELLWSKRDDLIGKIVEVKYNAVILSKDRDTMSLFLPIFIGFRDDKDETTKWVKGVVDPLT